VEGSISTQQARDTAFELATQVTKGSDVQDEKKEGQREAVLAGERTLETFLEIHYTPWVLASRKTGQDTLDRIQRNFPDLMPLSLMNISVRLVEQWQTVKLKSGNEPQPLIVQWRHCELSCQRQLSER